MCKFIGVTASDMHIYISYEENAEKDYLVYGMAC